MAMREQAATPVAAKRNWRACAQWRTDCVGVWTRSEISRNRMVSLRCEMIVAVAGRVRRLAVFRGCYSADQRRCSLLFRQHGSRESRDSAARVNLVAVTLMGYQREQPAPTDARKTKRRAITEVVND
jgi:hypothetical protein